MSTLPLKAMSRVWGRFNELTLPQWLRVPGFKLYSWVFGVKYVRRFFFEFYKSRTDDDTASPKSRSLTYAPTRT